MSDLPLFTALLPSDPSLLPLLRSQSTFTRPSRSSTSEVHKFLNKLGSFVCVPVLPGNGKSVAGSTTSNANTTAGREEWARRRDAWGVAKVVIEMDLEGYVLGGGWGKTWLLNLLGAINSNTIPPHSLPQLLPLLTTLHTHSSLSPTYHRTTSTPNLLKTSQAIVSALKRTLHPNPALDKDKDSHAAPDGRLVLACLKALPHLIAQNPTPHRPLLPTLLPLLHSLLLSPSTPSVLSLTGTDKQLRETTSNLLARLHTLSGKVAAGNVFRGDISGMIRESEGILSDLFDALYIHNQGAAASRGNQIQAGQKSTSNFNSAGGLLPVTASQPIFPGISGAESSTSGTVGDQTKELGGRVRALGRCLDGWVAGILGLLRFDTARPVGLPLGSLIALGLKCLSITSETLLEGTLDLETKALGMQMKRRLWSCGMKLLGGVVIAAGDHVLPNVGLILDKSVFLLETLPKSDHSTRIALFKFHTLLLSNLQLDPSSSSFHSRLMKQALGSASLVLDTKTPVLASSQGKESNTNADALGKKGKKRARGAGEEVVVAGIEGRSGKGLSRLEGEVVLSALRLIKIMHHHPSIPPHMLALSIRIHLSIAHTLECKTAAAVSQQDLGLAIRLSEAVADSLEDAMTIEGSGVRQGWIGSIVKQEAMARSSLLPLVLHPTAPPLSRPLPPVSTLAFYAVDDEEEEALRKEIGLRTAEEAGQMVEAINNGVFNDDKDQEDEETTRSYKRVATGNSSSVTRSTDFPTHAARSTVSATANSVFGSSASVAIPATQTAPTENKTIVPLSVPPTDTSFVAVVEPPVQETASTHQPTQVGVKDDADVAAAAMVQPFSSVTADLPARMVGAEPVAESASMAVPIDEDVDAIPEINLDSDSDEEDEDMS